MSDFLKMVVAPILACCLLIGGLVWSITYCDRTNSDWLLKEKSYTITEVCPNTNQFIINGAFILHLEDRYRFEDKDNSDLEVRDILDSDYRNRLLVKFNNNFGFVNCEVIGYLPEKHIKKLKGSKRK